MTGERDISFRHTLPGGSDEAITRAIADQARTIRIPVHMVETINKLVRTQRRLMQELGRGSRRRKKSPPLWPRDDAKPGPGNIKNSPGNYQSGDAGGG